VSEVGKQSRMDWGPYPGIGSTLSISFGPLLLSVPSASGGNESPVRPPPATTATAKRHQQGLATQRG